MKPSPGCTTGTAACRRHGLPLFDTRDAALAHWRTLASDAEARFGVEHRFDAAEVAPHVTWGTSPAQVLAITAQVPRPDAQP